MSSPTRPETVSGAGDAEIPDSVVVTGTGRAAAPPDRVVVELRLQGHGRTVTEALANLTQASDAAGAALPEQRLRTVGLGVHPRTDRRGEPLGHTAYQSLRVHGEDPAAAGQLIQRLGDAVGDALSVEQLRPEIADPAPLQLQAREAAVADARARAEHYASLLDRHLGDCLWVREGTGGGTGPGQVARMELTRAAGPSVDAADHEVVASVQIAWRLRP